MWDFQLPEIENVTFKFGLYSKSNQFLELQPKYLSILNILSLK